MPDNRDFREKDKEKEAERLRMAGLKDKGREGGKPSSRSGSGRRLSDAAPPLVGVGEKVVFSDSRAATESERHRHWVDSHAVLDEISASEMVSRFVFSSLLLYPFLLPFFLGF